MQMSQDITNICSHCKLSNTLRENLSDLIYRVCCSKYCIVSNTH